MPAKTTAYLPGLFGFCLLFGFFFFPSGGYNELIKTMNNTERLIFKRLLPLHLPQKTYRETSKPSTILSFHPLPGYRGEQSACFVGNIKTVVKINKAKQNPNSHLKISFPPLFTGINTSFTKASTAQELVTEKAVRSCRKPYSCSSNNLNTDACNARDSIMEHADKGSPLFTFSRALAARAISLLVLKSHQLGQNYSRKVGSFLNNT